MRNNWLNFILRLGLELNAETPKEISMSILSEIIMLQRGGTGKRMGVIVSKTE